MLAGNTSAAWLLRDMGKMGEIEKNEVSGEIGKFENGDNGASGKIGYTN